MTIMRTSLIAAFGLLAAGWAAPAAATGAMAAMPAVALGEAAGLHTVTDRGSWIEPKTRWKRDHDFGVDRRYDRYDRHHHGKHFKKKSRKHFKRGFRRGYSSGYDEGYYEGRRHSRFDRRHDHHYYYPDHRFRGGFYFGDGYYGGGSFRFRY